MILKSRYEDYTESEFLALLEDLFDEKPELDAEAHDKETRRIVRHFEAITEHPDGSDLIFYPRDSREDSPAGILEEVKAWRAANGKPGFKPE